MNTVLVVFDDWPTQLLSDMGIVLPNMEALSNMGTTYTNAVSGSALCGPARASIMTGVLPSEHGQQVNKFPLHEVNPEIETIIDVLGGASFAAGKVFDDRATSNFFFNKTSHPGVTTENTVEFSTSAKEVAWGTTDAFASESVSQLRVDDLLEWINKGSGDKFAAIGTTYAHGPWYLPKDEFIQEYLEMDIEIPQYWLDLEVVPEAQKWLDELVHEEVVSAGEWENALKYAIASAAYDDYFLGILLEELPEGTRVIVTADHGAVFGYGEMWMKETLYYPGIHVPLIVGEIGSNGGEVVDVPVSTMELMSTFKHEAGQETTGRNIFESLPDVPLLSEMASKRNIDGVLTVTSVDTAVTTQDWTFISFGTGGEALFHREDDPYQFTDLSEDPAYATIVAQFQLIASGESQEIPKDAVVIIDGDESNELIGSDLDDVIKGKGGNDDIFGEYGNDRLFGGNGRDEIHGGSGDDEVLGGGGNDAISGDEGNDLLFGEAGNDKIFGGSGEDQVSGGDGIDKLSGDEDNDTLDGGDASDVILGGNGNDSILGGSGDDILRGGNGSDIMIGGEGRDSLIGGGGKDFFVFNSVTEAGDIINSFQVGIDKVDVSGLLEELGYVGADPLADGVLEAVNAGADTLIKVNKMDGSATELARIVGISDFDDWAF